MKITKPIFIIGAGRSGTTVFYNYLSLHPEVCWFSSLTDRFPHLGILPVFHRLMDMPLVGGALKKRIVKRVPRTLRPSEGGNIYHHYCGIENKKRVTEDDLTPEMETKLKSVIERHIKFTGKPRFLSKQTANTQRIRLIDKMFPDAYYIHVIRDGRAVASSLYRVPFWNRIDIWWLGQKSRPLEEAGRERIEICGLHWQKNVREILANKYLFEDRYLEIRYEEFIEHPRETFTDLLRFCELKAHEKFLQSLPERLPNRNYKWKSQLTEKQQEILNRTVEDFMKELGYSM